METKFMAVMGPSGVGKSTIMHELQNMDPRFILIKTHVTRPLRPGETDRVSLTLPQLKSMRRRHEVLQINHIYSSYYAALPARPIREALSSGMFPMCDYKVPFAPALKEELSGDLFCVYLLPPDFGAIRERMGKSWGKANEARIEEDRLEIESLDTKYAGLIDLKIVSEEGQIPRVAADICRAYLRSLKS